MSLVPIHTQPPSFQLDLTLYLTDEKTEANKRLNDLLKSHRSCLTKQGENFSLSAFISITKKMMKIT